MSAGSCCDFVTVFARLSHFQRNTVPQYDRPTQTLQQNYNTPFTRYNRLHFDKRFDNRVERTAVRSTGFQTRLYNWFDNRLYTRYSRLSSRLSNGFDNRLNVCIHDTTCCQTGLTTGLTTGCFV